MADILTEPWNLLDPWKWRHCIPLKCWEVITQWCGITSQKNEVFTVKYSFKGMLDTCCLSLSMHSCHVLWRFPITTQFANWYMIILSDKHNYWNSKCLQNLTHTRTCTNFSLHYRSGKPGMLWCRINLELMCCLNILYEKQDVEFTKSCQCTVCTIKYKTCLLIIHNKNLWNTPFLWIAVEQNVAVQQLALLIDISDVFSLKLSPQTSYWQQISMIVFCLQADVETLP